MATDTTWETPKTYLFAADGSEPSKRALTYLLGMTRPGVDSVHVVTVTADDAAPEELQSLVHHYVLQLCEANIDVEHVERHSDAPAKELCAVAESGTYHMMVMGSRGLGKIKSKLLGSVSDYCVRHASIPVCIVRAPPKA